MGKKGGWFSAIKRVFVPHSKEKLANFERIRVWVDPDAKDIPSDVNTEEKNSKDKKKKGLGKRESNSFIPFFKEPSSIEKILGDAEREHKIIFRPPTPPQPLKISPSLPPRAASSRPQTPRVASPRAASPRTASPRNSISRDVSPGVVNRQKEVRPRPEPTLRYRHASATRIQAAYRGYVARRSFRALRGLVRLQGVMRGQNVKRQTANALKYMQLLVRVQSQIQSRRIQMLENQARSWNDMEVESAIGKRKQASEAGNEDWDDSLLTKEEIDARLQRKVDAAINRERAMAYAYSHQLWKSTPKSALTDIRSGGFPWWWNWLERQLPSEVRVEGQAVKNFRFTPPRPHSEIKPSPSPQPSSQKKQPVFGFDSIGSVTPLSTKSTVAIPSKQLAQTPPSNRFSQPNGSIKSKYSRMRGNGAESPFDVPLKDDDSLTSCPPFSVPSYMASTISAKAKVRAGSNPRERFPSTPGSESKRRISFPLTQGIGSFKWSKGSLFSGGKDSNSRRILEKHQPLHSIGNVSVDSTVSLPAGVGRKPFNRFV